MITQYIPFDFPAGKDNTEWGLFDRRAFPANSSPPADIAEGRLVGSRPNRKYCKDIPPYLVVQMPKTTAESVIFDNVPRMNDYGHR